MNSPNRTVERSIATFLFGFLAFSPPLLAIFGAEAFVLGLPLLYLYLFAAWGLIIAMIAWIADLGAEKPPDLEPARRAKRNKAD